MRNLVTRNRWMSLNRGIRLGELMKLVPDDEMVIVFQDDTDLNDEGAALFNGEVRDWWKDDAVQEMARKQVNGFQTRELADTIGAAIMVVVY